MPLKEKKRLATKKCLWPSLQLPYRFRLRLLITVTLLHPIPYHLLSYYFKFTLYLTMESTQSTTCSSSSSSGRQRLALSAKDKQKICRQTQAFPKQTQQQMANHFSLIWNKPIKRRTIGHVLSAKDKWLNLGELDSLLKKFLWAKH